MKNEKLMGISEQQGRAAVRGRRQAGTGDYSVTKHPNTLTLSSYPAAMGCRYSIWSNAVQPCSSAPAAYKTRICAAEMAVRYAALAENYMCVIVIR